jgi:hypothetical protein
MAIIYGISKSMCPSATRKPPLEHFLAPIAIAEMVRGPGDKAPENETATVETRSVVTSITYHSPKLND